jgi:hypothetical protein
MPIYSFLDTETNEEFELEMKMAQLDPFLKKNKMLKQIFTRMNIGDAFLLGVMKPPADFSKYVLGRIKDKVPGANVERGRYHVQKEI